MHSYLAYLFFSLLYDNVITIRCIDEEIREKSCKHFLLYPASRGFLIRPPEDIATPEETCALHNLAYLDRPKHGQI